MNINFNYKSNRIFSYVFLFGLFIIGFKMSSFISIYFLWIGEAYKFNFLNHLRDITGFIMKLSIFAQFTLPCLLVHQIFSTLNRQLKKLLTPKVRNLKSSFEIVRTQLKFKKIFFLLCNSIDIINKTFTFQVIILFLMILVNCLDFLPKILFNQNIFQIGNIFESNGIVHEFLNTKMFNHLTIYSCIAHLVFNYSTMTLMLYAANSVTHEAQASAVILSKSIDETSDTQKLNFVVFAAQTRSRNLNIQNFLFVINWNVFLSVRIKIRNNFAKLLFF